MWQETESGRVGAPTEPCGARRRSRGNPERERSEGDGRRGVGAGRSTEEGGEPIRRDPLEGRALTAELEEPL